MYSSVCYMDFESLLWQAIRRCEGQAGLARTLGYNKNSVRQWLIGIALPERDCEPYLAQLTGVTPDVVRLAIRDEMLRRWDRSRDRPSIRRLGRPPRLADPLPLPVVRSERPKNASDKKRRRSPLMPALLLGVGLGLGAISPHAVAATVAEDASVSRYSVASRRRAA